MMKRQGSSKGGKLPVLECHKGQGEEKSLAYPMLLSLGFGFVEIKKSQNMYANMQPNVLKYALQTGNYALKTDIHTSTEINPFIYFVYNLISIALSSTFTIHHIQIFEIKKYVCGIRKFK
jgi:hypothetical protein